MEIYPVIKTKDGEILDGFHRKAANPKWKEVIVDVKDPIEKVKIMMESNMNRRDVKIEEKQNWVKIIEEELKKQGKPYGTRPIAEILGISNKTISFWKRGVTLGNTPLSLDNRKLIPMYDERMVQESEINNKESRNDAYYIIKEGEQYPTLKRRTWFFHEDGREFTLREYARVQDFPDNFWFVGTKEKIKDQIGNAVSPKMAEYIAKNIPKGNAIELFAGCGGMSLGFERVGHNILWMNKFNLKACKTYHANFPKVIIDLRDIKDIKVNEIKKSIGEQEINLVFGGPPCQGFSIAGLKFKDDPRNELYKEFIRIIKGIKPKYFVMENVMGILQFKEQIIEDFESVGYVVNVQIVKGEEIGMKQKRHRVFFIGELK
jgi:site-specific DNA-cytosine methylase